MTVTSTKVPQSDAKGGWETKKLSQLSSMKSGATITARSIDQSSPYPCYGGNGLRGYTKTFTHDGHYALVGRQGALCGNVLEVSGRFFASEHAIVVTPHSGISISWLARAIDWMNLNKYTESSAQPGLSVTKILELSIAAPSDEMEQNRIAEALKDVESLIEALERLIAKKRDIKQAVMQRLLTCKGCLPSSTGEWQTERLGEICDIVGGGTPKTSESAYWNGGIPWCTPTDITSTPGKYLSKTERTITQLGARSSAARLLPAGTLLLCSRATIGEVKMSTGPITTNQGFKSLICRDKVNNEFLYYKLLTMKNLLLEKSFGSTFLEISKASLAEIEIEIPSKGEQVAIAGVLSDMDDEISNLESRLIKTRNIKQGMMQQLLTGRVRLI